MSVEFYVTLCIQAQPNTFMVTETPDNLAVADTLYAERISTVMSVRLEPNALTVAESSLTPTATEEAGGEITLNSVQASRC